METKLNYQERSPISLSRPAKWLAMSGALLLLVGLFVGAAIPLVPYPRLMISAHTAGFTVSGTLSIIAAFLLSSSLCTIPRRASAVVILGHVALWPLSFSEVAGAFWGTNQATPLAAAEAGAPGGAQWQEMIVVLCHVVPAIMLMAAWILLVWGVWRVFKSNTEPSL